MKEYIIGSSGTDNHRLIEIEGYATEAARTRQIDLLAGGTAVCKLSQTTLCVWMRGERCNRLRFLAQSRRIFLSARSTHEAISQPWVCS